MDPGSVEKAAAALLDAYATRTPVAPLTAGHPDMTVADAYAVQRAQAEAWTGAGARVKGHKVGLTSAAMQRQTGVDQPDFGVLLDTMFFQDSAPIGTGERGVSLEAGHVVLPGSITAAVPVAPGETITATFGGIGTVTAKFGGEGAWAS